jgi:hypothetical protein
MLAALLFVLLLQSQDAAPGADAGREPAVQARAEVEAQPLSAARERESRIVCRRETVTGSNRTRKVCEREGVTDHVRQQSQRWHENVLSGLGSADCQTNPELCTRASSGQ